MIEMTSSLPFRRAALAAVLASVMLPLAACGGGGEVSVSGGGSLGGASLSGSGTFRPGHQGGQSSQNTQNGQGAQGSQNAQAAHGGQSNQNPQSGQDAHGSQNAQGNLGGLASPGNQLAQNEQAGGAGAADSNGTGRQGRQARPGTDIVNQAEIDEVLAWLSKPHPEITPSIQYLVQFLDEGPDFRALIDGVNGKASQPEDALTGQALAYYQNRIETLNSGAVLNLDTEQRVLPKWSLTDEEVALTTAPAAYAQIVGRCGNASQSLEGFNRCMVGTYSGHTEQGESCSVNVGADGKVTFTLSDRQFPSFDIRHRAAFVERNASGDVTSAGGIVFSGWLSRAQVDATGAQPSRAQWFGLYIENYKGKPLVDVYFGNADPEHGPLVDESCYLGR